MAIVYAGTYTERLDHVNGRGKGIYVYALEEGQLHPLGVVRSLSNPSFLTVDAAAHRLYAVSEVMAFEGEAHGALQAFAIDPDSHFPEALNHQAIPGPAPCYVSLLHGHALVANYMGGSVTVVALQRDGSLGPVTAHVEHSGSGPNAARQEAPHPHAIVPDPGGKYLLVPDLGVDKVVVYAFDSRTGMLTPSGTPARVQPGAGPRHLAFDAPRSRAYLMNELDSTITAFAFEAGRLCAMQTLSALPEEYEGPRSGADIHVHISGRFLYASLRGPGSIVRLLINAETGHLTEPAWVSTHGLTPRNFAMDASGNWLIAANQDSDSLVVYRIDAATGLLSKPVQMMPIPSPACVRIVD